MVQRLSLDAYKRKVFSRICIRFSNICTAATCYHNANSDQTVVFTGACIGPVRAVSICYQVLTVHLVKMPGCGFSSSSRTSYFVHFEMRNRIYDIPPTDRQIHPFAHQNWWPAILAYFPMSLTVFQMCYMQYSDTGILSVLGTHCEICEMVDIRVSWRKPRQFLYLGLLGYWKTIFELSIPQDSYI